MRPCGGGYCCFINRIVVAVALKYCRFCFLRGLGGIFVAGTITIDVAFRRFAQWSGAHRYLPRRRIRTMRGPQNVSGPPMRCTCRARVGPTEAFLMSDILCQTQILNQWTWLRKHFLRHRKPQQRPAAFFKVVLHFGPVAQLWRRPESARCTTVPATLFLSRRWLSGAWLIITLAHH